jgi:TfoX/Sxy family transcriptional regulator of competence genes
MFARIFAERNGMAYNQVLAERVRIALTNIPTVEEKKMFGSLAFIVGGKMCINVGKDRLMCRIDPAIHSEAVSKTGVSTVLIKGREYKGYVYVKDDAIRFSKDLNYWLGLALSFNQKLVTTGR